MATYRYIEPPNANQDGEYKATNFTVPPHPSYACDFGDEAIASQVAKNLFERGIHVWRLSPTEVAVQSGQERILDTLARAYSSRTPAQIADQMD
jgi:hypothetical protein